MDADMAYDDDKVEASGAEGTRGLDHMLEAAVAFEAEELRLMV